MADVYRPHTYPEIEELVAPEVVTRLDEEELYGVFWYNRARATRKRVSTLGFEGREYRWSTTRRENPREQWIAIPVPGAGVPYDTWRAAREAVSNNRVPSKARLREFWELSGGIFRCSGCNNTMRPTASKVKGKVYAYYRCGRALRYGKEACPTGHSHHAEKIEEVVWEFVSGLMKDPERLRMGLDEMIEREREATRGDPGREAKAWADRIAEADRQRAKAQDLAIEGLLSPDELRAKLADLGETRETARRELAALEAQREQLAELESDRDIVIERYAEMVPENLDALTLEERHHLYKMLRLGVVSNVDRSLQVSGALAGTLEDEFRQLEAVSR